MPSNRLILRKMDSPWRTQHMDITRGTTLTHADLDNNFIFLKGEIIDSARLDGETLKLTKICGADIELSLSTLTQNNEDSLRNIEDDIKANTIWEWGSRGEKSIKVKNGSNNDATGDYSVSEGQNTTASGFGSHAEGVNTTASGGISHSEGLSTNASGGFSHAEGRETTASGKGSHAEGVDTGASGDASHAEGEGTRANGWGSHAEGISAIANGDASHAEGDGTRANGYASHAGGVISQANGDFSFAHTRGKVTFISKADGESSVVLGGTQHVVEGGGENSGVLLGDTNRILGLDYQKLINDTENEIKILDSERKKEHDEFISLENDLRDQLDIKREQIKALESEIDDLSSEISDLEFKKSELEAVEPRTIGIEIKINEITLVINNLETLVAQKQKELADLESEASQLKLEIEEATKKENEAQEVYEENRSRLEKLLDEYNKALYEFDGYLPKQSTIVGGTSNIINSASESVIDGGSGNTITPKVKNSGIFGGSKNELGGGTYIDLIARLEEELRQRAEEKAKYHTDTEKLIKSLQSDIEDKEKQLQSEKQQQPQDLGLIATLEAEIVELKEEKKVLEEELSRNNAEYVEYVNETNVKIEEYKSIEYAKYGEVPSTVITPIDGASIIAGSSNKIIHLSDNSSIIGGKSNLIDNASGSVILGGEGITATNNNTVYTPNLNIDIQPANDNSLTQVLVRDGDGNVKYKDVASFTDLSIVSGVYDIRTGIVTFINNDGDSFEIAGFTSGMTDSYTTDAYLEDKTIYFNNNIKGDDIYSVDISPILDDVIAAVGLNDRGECSIKSYNEYTSKVQEYYDSKKAYDEYESNIQILTDEITVLESSKTTKESELSTKQNELESIKPGSDFIIENAGFIFTVNQELNQEIETIRQSIQGWVYGKTETEFFAEKTALEDDIDSSIDKWNILNDLMVVNTTFNYQNKEEIINSLTNIKNSLDGIQTILDTMVYTDTEEVFSQNKTDIVNHVDFAIQSTHKLDSDVGLSIGYYEQTNNDLQNEIQQLQQEIDTINANIEQKQNDRQSYIDSKQQIIDSGALEFEPYVPANEVNFNCWLRYEIIKSVGYEDRGECSYKMYALYEHLYQKSLQEQEWVKQLESEKAQAQEIRNQEHANYISEKNLLEDDLSNKQNELNVLKQIQNPTQEELSQIAILEEQITYIESQLKELKDAEEQAVKSYTQHISFLDEQINQWYNASLRADEAGYEFFEKYTPLNEANFTCWRDMYFHEIQEDEINNIITNIGYNNRGECSSEQYTSYESEVNNYYDSKAQYDEYESNIQTLTDEIPQLNSDIDTLITEINTLDRTIILGRLDGIDQTDNQNLRNQKMYDLNSVKDELSIKQYQRQSYIDARQQIIDSGALEFAPYVPANEVNFNCWSEQQIIDSVGYDDRGTCDAHSYNMYQHLVIQLKYYQSEYNEWIIKKNRDTVYRTVENQNFIKEHDVITDNIAFYQGVLNQINQTIVDEGRDATPEELTKIAILEELIDDLIKNREELVHRENTFKKDYDHRIAHYNEQIAWFENNIKPDIDRYLPENEVNYNCWSEQQIISAVGYDDRGICSLDLFTEYRALAENYTNLKNEYDTLQANKQQIQTTISDLKSQLVNAETQEERDIINAQIQQNEEDLKQTLAQIEEIEATGDLDFVAYMPVNEANFNCWRNELLDDKIDTKTDKTLFNTYTSSTETVITDITSAVGYNDRGECSSEQYAIYENEVNLYYDSKEVYDTYESNIQTLTDEITQLNSDIDTLKSEINTLDRTIWIGKLDGIDQTDNQNLKNQKETDLDTKQAELEQKEVERERDIDRQQQIIDSGALEFAPYVPANEANFNCWSERQIIDSVGYDDRGTCDGKSYKMYQDLVQQLKAEQSQYNEMIKFFNEAKEVRTVENQNFIKEHDVITDNIAFYQGVLNQINQTIVDEGRDATPEELAKIAVLEQLINDLIKNREDLVSAETLAKKNYEELIAQYNEWIINFENNTKPDIDRYLPENEVNYNCWRNEFFYENAQSQRDEIISAVGYDDRGSCSEEQYAEYTSKVQDYYTSKEAYDTYESNIQILTDEITQLNSDIDTLKSELSTKQNELVSIRPGGDFIIANYDYIITVNQELSQGIQTIKSLIQGWVHGETEAEFFAKKTALEADIASSIDNWNMLNDLMVVNTTFNYQNKGSITIALTNIKNSLDDIQTISGTMAHTDTEEVFSQNKTDIVNHVDSAIQSSGEVQQDVTLSRDYYVQTNNDLKNDIEQLQQDIESLLADIEQKQLQKESYIDSKQQIIDSGALEFAPYVPANEANFNCWVNAKQTESLTSEINITNNNLTEQVEIINKTINEVVNNVGYDDRGDCSSKLFTEYRALAEQYISTKANYDNLQTTKQGLETNIGMLEEQIATSQSSSEPVDQERIDNLTAEIEKNKNDLAQTNTQILSIERSGDLDFAPYVPINEVNFICWVNNIEAVEPSIYNLETHLIDAMDDGHKGTFNYYPNIFDEFTENPTFIIGEFDDLDKIINISDGSRLTWAKAVVKSQWDNGVDMGNPLMDNLEMSVNVLERLKSAIFSAESDSQGEYAAIKVNYENMYAVLESENNTNGTDLDLYELQVKIQNLSNERQNEKEVNEYMVGKITEAIKVYDLIRNIAKNEIENSYS